MDHLYQQFDLIEEITRNDGSQYYEISNIDQNGFAELAAAVSNAGGLGIITGLMAELTIWAHPNPGCSRGLNPPVSSRDLAM